MRELTRRRGRTLGWVTLLLLTFAGGVVAGRLWRGDAGEDPARLALVTSVPQVPTPLPNHTPTPTAPDADAMDVGLDPERAAAEGVLPTLYLDIAPDDFAVIEAKREEALKTWILQSTNADFVPATVHVGDGPAVPVRLRLKGDWGDHFTRDKWSYRIEVRGSAAVMGMRVFSLQDPSTRSYVNEWAFLETLRREGVLAVGYGFAHVVQNGRPLGVYAVEEGFSKELLESQGRRESVIIRYNEDLLWETWAAYTNDEVTPPGVGRFHIIDEFGSGAVSADPVMAARRDAAVGRLRAWEQGMLPASDVFDVATLARYWALVDLWDARHAVYWNNLRYYYNPVTAKLEPIGFDAQPLFEGTPLVAEQLPGMSALLGMGDPRLQRAYAEALWATPSRRTWHRWRPLCRAASRRSVPRSSLSSVPRSGPMGGACSVPLGPARGTPCRSARDAVAGADDLRLPSLGDANGHTGSGGWQSPGVAGRGGWSRGGRHVDRS